MERTFTFIGRPTTVEPLQTCVHFPAAVNIELVASDLPHTTLRFSVFTGPLGADLKSCVLAAQYDISAQGLLSKPVGTSADLTVGNNPGVLRVFFPRRDHLRLSTLWSTARTVQSYRFVDTENKLLNVREECVAMHLTYLVPLQFLRLRKREVEQRRKRLEDKYVHTHTHTHTHSIQVHTGWRYEQNDPARDSGPSVLGRIVQIRRLGGISGAWEDRACNGLESRAGRGRDPAGGGHASRSGLRQR